MKTFNSFRDAVIDVGRALSYFGRTVPSERWQSTNRPDDMRELLNCSFIVFKEFKSEEDIIEDLQPNTDWVREHLLERLSCKPLNPGLAYKNWPYYKDNSTNDIFRKNDGKFDHTYMERIWCSREMEGIRFYYGNLYDVKRKLLHDPYTRQAYLPIWFPEDTNADDPSVRVPCTLGYHFIMRDNMLHVVYYIRSCDYIRHFKDDIYFAYMTMIYILNEMKASIGYEIWDKVKPGTFTMHITSLHIFEKEIQFLNNLIERYRK